MAYTVQALCQFSVCTARHVHDCFADFVAKNLSVDVSVPSVPGYTTLMSVFGWIIIHQNVDSNFNWYRLWADYKAGFGSIDADFWLGLEKMHLLTSSQAYRLRVEVQEETTGDWYSAEYWTGTRPSTGLVLGRVLDVHDRRRDERVVSHPRGRLQRRRRGQNARVPTNSMDDERDELHHARPRQRQLCRRQLRTFQFWRLVVQLMQLRLPHVPQHFSRLVAGARCQFECWSLLPGASLNVGILCPVPV